MKQWTDIANVYETTNVVNVSQQILQANYKRVGFIIYNVGASSLYVTFGPTANSSTNVSVRIGADSFWQMTAPVYRGVISAIRNGAGTGRVLVTEFI